MWFFFFFFLHLHPTKKLFFLKMKFSTLFKKPILLIAGFLAATVVAETVPTTAQVKVKSYNWDGTTLSGQIYVSFSTIPAFTKQHRIL